MTPFVKNILLRGSKFSPEKLTGLSAWYSADVGVLTSVGPDVPATNGQTVRRWLDRSGNSRDLNQTTLANQPTFTGGKVVFTRSLSTKFDEATLTLTAPYTIVFCARRTSTATFQCVVGQRSSNNGFWGYSNSTTFFGESLSGFTITAASVLNTTESIVAVVNSASSFVQIGSNITTGNMLNNSLATFSIGSRNGNTFLDGEIAEVALYSRAISNEEATKLSRYFFSRWGATP